MAERTQIDIGIHDAPVDGRRVGVPKGSVVGHPRLAPGEDHHSAGVGEPVQCCQRGSRQNAARRDHHRPVQLAALVTQAARSHAGWFNQRLLVDEVEVPLRLQQPARDIVGSLVGGGVAQPQACRWGEKGDARGRRADGEQIAGTVGVLGQGGEVVPLRAPPPVRRMEVLAELARVGKHQHALEQVDAADKLIIHHPFRLLDGEAAAVDGKALAERARAAIQVRRGTGQLGVVCHRARPDLAPDGVYARHLHIAHVAEIVARQRHQGVQVIVVIEVDDVLQAVGRAPIRLYAEEVLAI